MKGEAEAGPRSNIATAAPTLTRVFYADNGSSAIEVALKLSFHYWRNLGRGERTRFIALTGGYHGETLGALSVTDVALYRSTYAPLLLDPIDFHGLFMQQVQAQAEQAGDAAPVGQA